jgi:hypothetical protein
MSTSASIGAQQRLLAFLLEAATLQIAVELVFQEAAHLGVAVFLLEHHQCRVFGQAFGDELGALHAGRHLLMRPPLMRDLVGSDEVRVVDVLGVAVVDLCGKADRFVERHGVGERFREPAVAAEAREFDDAHDLVLVRRVVAREIGE